MNNREQVALCPYCKVPHWHGLGNGHRVAHCGAYGSVASRRYGYYLQPSSDEPPAWLSAHIANTGPRADEQLDGSFGEPENLHPAFLDWDASNAARAAGFLTRSQLHELPPVEPLIEQTLDIGTLAVLYAPWGAYKSFLAVDWACCIAAGVPWQGRPIHGPDGAVDEPDGTVVQTVLYVAAEGGSGLDGRITAWEQVHGVSADGVLVRPRGVTLMHDNEGDMLANIVRETGATFVVIDTLRRCAPGAEENSSKDMSKVVEQLDKLRDQLDGTVTVLVVHHAGKDGVTMRGSSVLEDAVDTVYRIEKRGDGTRRLSRTKRKDGPERDVWDLTLVDVDGTGSCVLDAEAVPESSAHPSSKRDGKPFRPTTLMERVSQFLELSPGSSTNSITKWVSGNRSAILAAIKRLSEEGYVERTPSTFKGKEGYSFRVLVPFLAAEDAASEGRPTPPESQ